MPEFIMEGRDHAARLEAPFVLGFIEAMFFTNVESSVFTDTWDTVDKSNLSDLPGDVGYTDLHPDSLAAIRLYCVEWQCEAADQLTEAYAHPIGYDEVQAGCDLWFTMNGHGVGFWDRDLEDVGDKLADLARHKGVYPYFEAPFVHLEI